MLVNMNVTLFNVTFSKIIGSFFQTSGLLKTISIGDKVKVKARF